MARPKEKISQAFAQKSIAAADKLRKFQAERLKNDIERLVKEEIHPDVRIVTDIETVACHSCIIRARSENLHVWLQEQNTCSTDGLEVCLRHLSSANQKEALQCFRLLYTVDDASPVLKRLEKCLRSLDILEAGDKNTEINNEENRSIEVNREENRINVVNEIDRTDIDSQLALHSISENITNFSLDRVKREAFCVTNDLNTELQKLAERIVGKVIADAKEVVSEGTIDDQLNICDTVRELWLGDGSAENVELEQNSEWGTDACMGYNGRTSGSENKNVSVLESLTDTAEEMTVKSGNTLSETSTLTEGMDRRKQSQDLRFKATQCDVSKSLEQLLDNVYGMHMVLEAACGVGEDLLRLLLRQENCDCVIQTDGHFLHAHRCILSARSSYFEAMLGGSWREAEEECIVLEGIDEMTLKQMLLYLYGGVISLGSTCSLGRLIQVADMYSIDGLKEVVAFNLNMEYCHFFHRPCPGCISGIPETLALSIMYNIDTLKDRSVKWINKNFGKVWGTKNFAHLPPDVLELCVSSAIQDLAIDNVIDILVECRQVNEKLPKLKWTEPIFDMITMLMDAAIEFSSQNFVSLISGDMLRKIDKKGVAFNKQPIEDIFGIIIMTLSPEMSCQAHIAIYKWIRLIQERKEEQSLDPLFSEEIEELVTVLYKKSKQQLCLYIHQVANTEAWSLLTKDMQKEILEEANYVCFDTNKGKMSRPKLSSMQKKLPAKSGMSLREYFECHFGHTRSDPAQQGKGISRRDNSSGDRKASKWKEPQGLSGPFVGDKSESVRKQTASKQSVLKQTYPGSRQTKGTTKNMNKTKEVGESKQSEVSTDRLKDLTKINHVVTENSDELVGEKACENLVGRLVDDDYVEVVGENDLDRLRRLCTLRKVEIMDMPNPLHFCCDKLVPIFDVVFISY